jgi:hypothetical protein
VVGGQGFGVGDVEDGPAGATIPGGTPFMCWRPALASHPKGQGHRAAMAPACDPPALSRLVPVTLTPDARGSIRSCQSDPDQRGSVRKAKADPAGGPDGDPVAGEEHRPVCLDLGVASDGGDHPRGGQAPDGARRGLRGGQQRHLEDHPAGGLGRVRGEQRLARAGRLLHVRQHQRGRGVGDEGGDLRAHVGCEHLGLGEGVQVTRGGPGGDVLHTIYADGEGGQAVGLLPTLGGSVTEEGDVDLAGDVPGQAPPDLSGASGEPSHPDASLTPTRARTPTTRQMIMLMKDPG